MILIIDDDQTFARNLEIYLLSASLEAIAINTATEALAFLQTHKPALIILDLLPLIDGSTILHAIRQNHALRNIPILVLTSEASREKQSDSLHAGAQEFFIKGTVGTPALLERIHELLGTPLPPPAQLP